MDIRPRRLAGRFFQKVKRLHHGSHPLRAVLEHGLAASPQHDVELVGKVIHRPREFCMSSGATRRSIWPRSLIVCTMGQRSIRGSPSKYICVISRCPKAWPKIEKWICIGRQSLARLGQG
jgi:hypothetical protein